MQEMMDADIAAGLLPAGTKIQPWDWAYYTEKVRKAKYALDEEQTKPYFQMENVRQGVFDLTTKLFGLQYEKLSDIPVYHPDVEGFKVMDADGSLIGVILTDYFPRSTKRGGAWMNNMVNQEIVDGVEIRPVIVNVGNFSKPAKQILCFHQIPAGRLTAFHNLLPFAKCFRQKNHFVTRQACCNGLHCYSPMPKNRDSCQYIQKVLRRCW